MNLNVKSVLLSAAMLLSCGEAFADPWRDQVVVRLESFSSSVEVLDESLHEAHGDHGSPAFTAAIANFHEIEDIVFELMQGAPTQPFANLCRTYERLYRDLVQIRYDLEALGLGSNRVVLGNWTTMVNIFNYQLNPYFATCGIRPYTGRRP